MGQTLSCGVSDEQELLSAALVGDLKAVEEVLKRDSTLVSRSLMYDRSSILHIAAAHGHIDMLSFILDRTGKPDSLNRQKQTPLMLAATHGKISCVKKLIESGASILMFDSEKGRTCLHHAASYGHSDCLQVILSAALTSQIAASWGFTRFVNIRDGKGATPLHLAALRRRPDCVRILLGNGALVCSSTGGVGFPGSTPLHLAAMSGSLDCITELLAWGADRLQQDEKGRIPYYVALRHQHGACAALLNPSSAEPIVWPSPLKFINELNPDAKALLESALMQANKEREKSILKGSAASSLVSSSEPDSVIDAHARLSEANDDLCFICFDHTCTIEIRECGHRLCAQCTLALCCHSKPNPAMGSPSVPVCPFCRSNIVKLVVAKKTESDVNSSKPRKSWRSRNLSEGSSSFKGLSAVGSFSKIGRGSGRIASENEWLDKQLEL